MQDELSPYQLNTDPMSEPIDLNAEQPLPQFAEGGEVMQEPEEPDSEGYYQQLLAQYAGYGAPQQTPVQSFAEGGAVAPKSESSSSTMRRLFRRRVNEKAPVAQPVTPTPPNAGNPPLLGRVGDVKPLPRIIDGAVGDVKPLPRIIDGGAPWMPTVPQPAPRPNPNLQLRANPNLSPGILGGQQNLGLRVDRLGNVIAAPMEGPTVRTFAKGGSVSLDAMSALIDASEPQTEDEAAYDYMTQSQRMLEDLGPRTSPRQATGMRRVLAPSGGGAASPKEMELAAGPLATGQDFAVKEPKGKGKGGKSAKEQLQALAKQYKLKLRATENESRGLMRSTLGAPTLEQPTLTSETLGVRRFQKGGEAKKSEEVSQAELDAASRPAFVSPSVRRATKISQANDPTDRIMGVIEPALTLGTGAVSSVVGMPFGIFKGLTSGKFREGKAASIASKEAADFIERNTYVPRSESGRENLAALGKIAEDLKLAPTPGGAAMASLARPTAVRAQAANIADDFQQYNRQLAAPGASYAIRPDNPQFIPTSIMSGMMQRLSPPDQMGERPAQRLEKLRAHFGAVLDTGEGMSPQSFAHLQRSRASLEQQAALDKWVNSTLKKYITRDMATPSDPVRKLAEEGITIKAYELDPTLAARAQTRRNNLNNPDRLGQSEAARMYEDIADASFRVKTAGYLTSSGIDSDLVQKNPYLFKLAPETPVSRASTFMSSEAEDNFKHLVDVIGEDLAAGRLRPDALNKLSMADAVKRAHAYNQEVAKRMDMARVDAMKSRPVYKQYDSGYKWIQLTEPGDFSAESDAMGHSVRGYEPPKGSADWKPASGTSGFDSYGVGGWNAIKEGRAKVFSLRDEKGQPHATAEVEVRPAILSDWIALGEDDFQDTVNRLMSENPGIRNNDRLFKRMLTESPEFQEFSRRNEQTIVQQIKGKQNAAVAPKYQEFGQDFLRNGQWSKVKDADKVGLFQTNNGLMSKNDILGLYEALPDNVKNTGFVQERLDWLKSGAAPEYDYYGGYVYARDSLGRSSSSFP